MTRPLRAILSALLFTLLLAAHALPTVLGTPARLDTGLAADHLLRLSSNESFTGGVGESVGSGQPPFPYPTAAAHPPTYNYTHAARVVFSGVQIQIDNHSQTNDFRADTELLFSAGLDYAAVYPVASPPTVHVMNATEVLQSGDFVNFTYYAKPLARFVSSDNPNRNFSYAAELNPPGIIKYSAQVVALKQLATVARPGVFYAAWRAADPQNISERAPMQNGFLDYGFLEYESVPCEGAGIVCG